MMATANGQDAVTVGYLALDPTEIGAIIRRCLPEGWRLELFRSGDAVKDYSRISYLVVAGSQLTAEDIAGAPLLRLVHKVGVGYDDMDLDALRARGIALAVCPVGSDEAVAEHALALALASLKCIPELDRGVRDDRGWPKWEVRGRLRLLRGRRIGIVGYGRIGRLTAELFSAFGCDVLVFTRTRPAGPAPAGVRFAASLDELFGECSIVSMHVPLSEETRGMVRRRHLDLLGPDGLFVNTARGQVVVEAELAAALREGTLGAAAVDVLTEEPPPKDLELLDLPNLIVTPHIGGGGLDVFERKVGFIVRNIENFHAGKGAAELILGADGRAEARCS